MRAELAHDAADAAGFPKDGLVEVAVLGRSNVGKSTLINALIGRRNLARTSSTPGKTRRIHFYRLEQQAYLVDLPGFGYAAVSRTEQRTWRPLVESYLRGDRASLRGCIVLMDIRRGPQAEENDLLEWLDAEGIPIKLAFTTTDKIRAAELGRRLAALREELTRSPDTFAAVSGRTGRGLDALAGWLEAWTGLTFTRADGTPFGKTS